MMLSPGASIGRYQVKSLLGTGGMSEVYLAYDSELCRQVALKLMAQTSDSESLRRFRQEARAASALNHPNILTVYDFGQCGTLHYLVTELIDGKTLRQQMSQGPIELSDALEIIIQIGTGLKAAHQVGIVHRDIKPENIIVLPDGYIKILDFGLAKLTLEPLFAPSPQASTASIIDTHAGRILGTVNYMSPEQLRGHKVDQRSDIWSLGVLLFEMLVQRRPFEGESTSDVIAAILERPVSPPVDREIPSLIWKVIEKALIKDCRNRYETADSLVADLKKAQRELEIANSLGTVDRLSATSNNAEKSVTNPVGRTSSAHSGSELRIPRRGLSILILVGIALLAFAVVYILSSVNFRRRATPPRKPLQVNKIMAARDHLSAAISPDGGLYAYSEVNEAGLQSLRLGQVNAPGSKELIAPSQGTYRGITFTPDGNWIYFTVFGLKENTTSGTLFRISKLGSAKQPLVENVDSRVTFSADGQRFAFFRSVPEQGRDQLIIANTEGKNLQVLSERVRPLQFYLANVREAPAWSPDGKLIASPVGHRGDAGEFMTVVTINVETGREEAVTTRKWLRVGYTQWLNDGKSIIITAAESATNHYQLFRVSIADNEVSPVYPDLDDYQSISLSENGKLFAVTTEKTSTIFTARKGNLVDATRMGSGLNEEGLWGLSWTPRGEIVYVSTESRNLDIWIKGLQGGDPHRQLTFHSDADFYPTVSPDGRYVVFVSNRTGSSHLWRINSDGTELKQLTDKSEESFPQITPDGRWVIYSSKTEGRPALWKVSIEGGAQTRLMDQLTSWPAISPDGKWIACLTKEDSINEPIKLAIISTEDLKIHQTFKTPEGVASPELPPVIRWLPDERGVSYIVTTNGISNIFVQLIEAKRAKPITDFTADRIFWFDWSSDGKLAYARGVLSNKAVVIENF